MKKTWARNDLHLLSTLYVLLEERSVTRAAERLSITQSAMSKWLQRLREMFDDPLFVPSSHGLVPTTRATELVLPLQQIFEQVESCLKSPSFDPATAHGRVRIATPEQFALVTILQLLLRLRDIAPNLILESQHLMDNHLELLAAGGLDFVINLDQPYPDGYNTRRIYSASPMLWCRKQHPLARKRSIEIADISTYPLITFRTQNMTQHDFRTFERKFTKAGLGYKVILDTSHLLIALGVLVNTDALMLAPDYLSRLSVLQDKIVPLPISHIHDFSRLRINLSLVQHERTINSPQHQWIADEIADILSDATAGS